ncbi:MAG: 2'-5' RNA ligase family protein [Sphingobium sp.]
MAAGDHGWADGLRRRYFPPERNRLPAHITLFHHLPPSCVDELQGALAVLVKEPRPPARIDRLLSIGNGVALHIDSPALLAMREQLAERFHGLLTPQDRATPRLHITIQNKVSATEARLTLAALDQDFRPRMLAIAGLAAWYYDDGAWSLIRRFGFRG